MLTAIASTALFLFWEIAILLAAARIAQAASRDMKSPSEEFFAVMVSVAMLIEGIAASALSFARANSIPAYAAVAVLCLVCSARRAVVAEFLTRLRGLSLSQFRLTAAILLSAAIPLFFLTLKSIDEPDSATIFTSSWNGEPAALRRTISPRIMLRLAHPVSYRRWCSRGPTGFSGSSRCSPFCSWDWAYTWWRRSWRSHRACACGRWRPRSRCSISGARTPAWGHSRPIPCMRPA